MHLSETLLRIAQSPSKFATEICLAILLHIKTIPICPLNRIQGSATIPYLFVHMKAIDSTRGMKIGWVSSQTLRTLDPPRSAVPQFSHPPDEYHCPAFDEIDKTENPGAASLFPSGIIHWVFRPLAEWRPLQAPAP
jgi:hypothetical protein